MIQTDYAKYHQLEDYLLREVAGQFRKNKKLSAFEFFSIVVWKANRSKSRVAARMLAKRPGGLQFAVTSLTIAIASAPTPKERLRILIEDWGLRLPMATAILTILYPDEFTIYDVRVCGSLGGFHHLKNPKKFETLWTQYLDFKAAVIAAVPHERRLRSKDRYLWGKSFEQQLKEDIKSGFASDDDKA